MLLHDKVRVLFFENCHTNSSFENKNMACCKVLAKEKNKCGNITRKRNGKRKRGCKYSTKSTVRFCEVGLCIAYINLAPNNFRLINEHASFFMICIGLSERENVPKKDKV